MRNLKEYLEHYVYAIETIDGKKLVHVDGYVYCEDNTYKLVQFLGMYVDADKVDTTYFLDLENYTKGTIADISYEDAVDYYANLKERSIVFSVDESTPDGIYIDIL